MERIPREDQQHQTEVSLLGIKWVVSSDHLKLSLKSKPNYPWSKRKISQFIGKHYDPLGLLAPILLP
uniref:Transposase n=2 Tax=Syphacia muris TaxID=451379 RepID=A0A0N5ABW8_9BILA